MPKLLTGVEEVTTELPLSAAVPLVMPIFGSDSNSLRHSCKTLIKQKEE